VQAEPSTSWLRLHTENRIDGLLWGVLLALMMQNEAAREWLRTRFAGWAAAGVILSALGLLALFPFPPVHRTIVAIIPPMLIAYTVLQADGFAGRFLELPPLRWLGRISYGLYVWQMLFVVLGPRPLGVLQAFPLALICPLLCATLSYSLLERPMMRLGARIGTRMGHQVASPRLKAA
jgi:peptidoglycan/LPS O-acetylase OafA/YrhL